MVPPAKNVLRTIFYLKKVVKLIVQVNILKMKPREFVSFVIQLVLRVKELTLILA